MAVLKMPRSTMLVIPLVFSCLGIQPVLSAGGSPVAGFGADLAVAPLAALLPRATSSSSTGQDTYTCGPGSPCSNGACCGSSGWCGYGATYCGAGCQSNCNATADCGEYAAVPGATCPLNVCCSQYGFCGYAIYSLSLGPCGHDNEVLRGELLTRHLPSVLPRTFAIRAANPAVPSASRARRRVTCRPRLSVTGRPGTRSMLAAPCLPVQSPSACSRT